MGLFAGIDLHSRNSFIAISDEQDKPLLARKIPNDLQAILDVFRPYQRRIRGIVVESTFNDYWLVDGLMDAGYKLHLAHPPAIKPYNALRYRNDQSDAFFLARLLRLGILPEGYIFPKRQRPMRDLARTRLKLVRDRSSNIHRFQSLVSRELGRCISGDQVKKLQEADIPHLLPSHRFLHEAGQAYIGSIRFLTLRINRIERLLNRCIQKTDAFRYLSTIPGIGEILAFIILTETGPISRFPSVGDYNSYCRMVPSEYISVGRKKGKCHLRAGNPYLHWAFVEGVHCFKRYCPEAKQLYDHRKTSVNGAYATMVLGSKLCRASYAMLKYHKEFDVNRMFRN